MPAFETVVKAPEEEIDLALAALLVARVETPGLDPRPWLERLDDLAHRSGIAVSCDPSKALTRLRRFLFEEEGFHGNRDDYFDPLNSCLDQVVERRIGIPITLSVLMMEIGRRVGVAIEGVGLPGHFVVRAQTISATVLIDPFHGGSVLSVADAEDVIAEAVGRRVDLQPAHFAPVSKRQILGRMLANLKSVYIKRENWAKALQVIDWLLAIDDGSATQTRDRGTVLMKLGQFQAGAAAWERYLTRHPNAKDSEKLRGQLRRIRQALASLN
ncbi:MAG: transglutaminase family protein [Candidatus Rokubacteria bacterium]|nr:transglutaminase family protein [Candidatus Rokubacteria bacterium]